MKVLQEEDEESNDPSKLTLAERVRMFERPLLNSRPVQKDLPQVAAPRKRRLLCSRFQTQPITSQEVHRARKVNLVPIPPLSLARDPLGYTTFHDLLDYISVCGFVL